MSLLGRNASTKGAKLTSAVQATIAAATLAVVAPATAVAQDMAMPQAGGLPFYVGERLSYQVRVSRFGGSGKGEMSVDGPVDVRGTSTYLIRSDVETRVGPMKVVNRSESWLDVTRMASLRFRKRERKLGGSASEAVELFPERRAWQIDGGRAGESLTDAPLDELSFIYFLRTVPLEPDSTYSYDRHFDPARNPTVVRVVGRESLTTPAGRFATVVVEMRVKDTSRYGGDGVIRINFTDDHCRIPVRIESTVPLAGHATLTLERHSHPTGTGAAVGR